MYAGCYKMTTMHWNDKKMSKLIMFCTYIFCMPSDLSIIDITCWCIVHMHMHIYLLAHFACYHNWNIWRISIILPLSLSLSSSFFLSFLFRKGKRNTSLNSHIACWFICIRILFAFIHALLCAWICIFANGIPSSIDVLHVATMNEKNILFTLSTYLPSKSQKRRWE